MLGASKAGKSDLALRLIDDGGKLIADDVVVLDRVGDRIRARAPAGGRGKIELRGQGIFRFDAIDDTMIDQVVHCVPADRQERLPTSEVWTYDGMMVPSVVIDSAAASALARLRAVIRQERLA